MHHFFVKSDQIWQNSIRIEGKDVNHMKNVLRMKPGDRLKAADEAEVEYLCEIERIDADAVWLNILERIAVSRELPVQVYLFQALPKSDKMEWIIEKAVELGVHAIVPMQTRRCVVRLDAKKAAAKVKRWNAISESAAKQSKRTQIPLVHSVMAYPDALSLARDFQAVCIPYEDARGMKSLGEYLGKIQPGIRMGFFIGPEGGFEPVEIGMAREMGIMPVSLGSRILRTETAGLALMSAIMLRSELGRER